MAAEDDLHQFDLELARVVDRLNGMPLARAATATDSCYAVAEFLLDRTRDLTDEIPAGASLPRLAPAGLGALIAVLGRDYRDAVQAAPGTDVSAAVDRLVGLRRSLP